MIFSSASFYGGYSYNAKQNEPANHIRDQVAELQGRLEMLPIKWVKK
jgi:hypothetical protein